MSKPLTATQRIEKILKRYEKLQAEKLPWLPVWQLIGDYIHLKRQNFTRDSSPGQFLVAKIFDGTGPRALHLMVTSIMGNVFPSIAKTFIIGAPNGLSEKLKQDDEIIEYYRWFTKQVICYIKKPKAGLQTALDELGNELGGFGLGGIETIENESRRDPITFKAVNCKQMTIDENIAGYIDVVYKEDCLTVRQCVQEYGYTEVSDKCRKLYDRGEFEEKVYIIQAVEPRVDRLAGGFGNANMPVASIHIDKNEKVILRESGFHEMPIHVGRFWKCMGEKYGRSPAMEAMPDVLEINAFREAMIVAIEKILDPPIAVTQDGVAGGAKIDTSAGAINVRNTSGRMQDNGRWIEPIMTVGDIKPVKERILEIEQAVSNTFMIDRLLDFNNETRMTLGEANLRDRMRGQALGGVYNRIIAEVLDPMLERAINILFNKNLLGVIRGSELDIALQEEGKEPVYIPDAIVDLIDQGEDAYELEYVSPAARIMRAEELMGIQQTISYLEALGPINPGVFDAIDIDKMVAKIVELTGAPEDLINDSESVKAVRESRAQAQQQAQQVQDMHIKAQTARGFGQAAQAAAKAGLPLEQVVA